jgi:hemoglobin
MRRLMLFLCLLSWLGAPWAQAVRDDSLYRHFGERAGIAALMDDFVQRLKADPRIGAQFKDSSARHLARQLTDQVCVVTGGPCVYEGEPMDKSHRELGITMADFNALVEVLQAAMAARGIGFAHQNALLARLAPMHREIVTR